MLPSLVTTPYTPDIGQPMPRKQAGVWFGICVIRYGFSEIVINQVVSEEIILYRDGLYCFFYGSEELNRSG